MRRRGPANNNNNNNLALVGLQQGHKIFLLSLVLWIFAVVQFRAEFSFQESLLLQQKQESSSAKTDHDSDTTTTSSTTTTTRGGSRYLSEGANNNKASSSSSSSSSRRRRNHDDHLIVDILSIGSERRTELLTTQQQTFGSHVSVRQFFTATEIDDIDDPNCNTNLRPDDTFRISRFCKQRKWDEETHRLMRFLKNSYANLAWLKKKANPVGWMCAQRRPLHGLYKVFQSYQQQQQQQENGVLPDYLIMMDDDTYFNLEQFQQLVLEENGINQQQDGATQEEEDPPLVFAGCLVRVPVMTVNFTFGFGGYGTILNRAALQRLMEPIYCDEEGGGGEHNNIRRKNEEACAQVERNMIGEQKLFQSGMSVLELINAFVNYQPYKDYATWVDGYCMHSDWVLGYFVNHYNISSHVTTEPFYDNVPQARMEEWQGSVIYRKGEGFCKNENVNNCQPDSVTCHYMTAEAMTNFTNIVKAIAPAGRFVQQTTTTTTTTKQQND